MWPTRSTARDGRSHHSGSVGGRGCKHIGLNGRFRRNGLITGNVVYSLRYSCMPQASSIHILSTCTTSDPQAKPTQHPGPTIAPVGTPQAGPYHAIESYSPDRYVLFLASTGRVHFFLFQRTCSISPGPHTSGEHVGKRKW